MASIRDQISEAVFKVVSATMNKPVEELADATRLIADLGAKSVNFVRIISVLEDEFDLDVSFQEFRRKKTIGEMIEYLVQLHDE